MLSLGYLVKKVFKSRGYAHILNVLFSNGTGNQRSSEKLLRLNKCVPLLSRRAVDSILASQPHRIVIYSPLTLNRKPNVPDYSDRKLYSMRVGALGKF